MRTFMVLCILSFFATNVKGHGMMVSPPGRSKAGRKGHDVPLNYDANGLNCGGFWVMKYQNGGQCGVCGDPFNGPKPNEPGPSNIYATGATFATYTAGTTVPIRVRITAAHSGYFEYGLCVNDVPQNGSDPSIAVTQDCFRTLQSPTGNSRFRGGTETGDVTHTISIPADVECRYCVLQWRWVTGNSWGCSGPECGLGQGSQEAFWNCADVAIVGAGGHTGQHVVDQGQTGHQQMPHGQGLHRQNGHGQPSVWQQRPGVEQGVGHGQPVASTWHDGFQRQNHQQTGHAHQVAHQSPGHTTHAHTNTGAHLGQTTHTEHHHGHTANTAALSSHIGIHGELIPHTANGIAPRTTTHTMRGRPTSNTEGFPPTAIDSGPLRWSPSGLAQWIFNMERYMAFYRITGMNMGEAQRYVAIQYRVAQWKQYLQNKAVEAGPNRQRWVAAWHWLSSGGSITSPSHR